MRSWREKESWKGGGGDRGEVPNDSNLSILPSFANTDALSSSRIRQLSIACQPLTPSSDPLSELSSRHSLTSRILYHCVSFLSCSALNHSSQKLTHTHTPTNPFSTSMALLSGSTTTEPTFLRTKPCPWHAFVLYNAPGGLLVRLFKEFLAWPVL